MDWTWLLLGVTGTALGLLIRSRREVRRLWVALDKSYDERLREARAHGDFLDKTTAQMEELRAREAELQRQREQSATDVEWARKIVARAGSIDAQVTPIGHLIHLIHCLAHYARHGTHHPAATDEVVALVMAIRNAK